MALESYRAKRDFARTSEPSGNVVPPGDDGLAFVVQRHDASRLHYDLRLEWDGVLWSWAVPKGPSLDPADRRLAVRTEDHPVEYLGFEGVIPAGEYGAGTMVVWDHGVWTPAGESRDDPAATVRSGKLDFELAGGRLRGGWKLVKMGGKAADDGDNWLLIKAEDATARPAETPAPPKPALARLTTDVPTGEGWVHEIKHDGYRILAHRADDRADDDVRLLTRKGLDWTDRFPLVARAVAGLACHRAVIDGEVVALGADGRSDFGLLQQALSDGRSGALVYYAFDLLHLDGWDLTGEPLLERKRLLAQLLGVDDVEFGPKEPLRYSDHVVGQGPAFHARACEIGLEGIISKRSDAPYRPGRKGDWKKIKCLGRQEMVVGGWTEPSGSRSGLGALLLGHYEDGRLHYSGKVGTGFSSADLGTLPKRLAPLERPQPPFVDPPTGAAARGAHWVAPELVAEIAFIQWTRDGALRHPSFQGLRDDKDPRDVRRERSDATHVEHAEQGDTPVKTPKTPRPSDGPAEKAEIRGIRLSSPGKVLYPDQGVTKRDLALYYDAVADWCLPHVAGRPLSLVRCPAGREAHCFYQKHAGDGFPEEVARIEIEEKDGELAEYLIADTAQALVALVQMGTLELHVWGSRRDRIERPDRCVLDLDPGEGVEWSAVVEAARDLRDRLGELGLTSYVKTTGGKGLHVVVPLTRVAEFDAVKAFSKLIAEDAVRRRPERYVANMAKAKRGGKIFVDYLRNGRGATFVAPYSTRARPGAPVSVPLAWEELSARRRSDHYTVANTPRRLASLEEDPWEGIDRVRQQITRAMWKELGATPPAG